MGQDGQHWQGLQGSCPGPGPPWQAWQHCGGEPAPLGGCLVGDVGDVNTAGPQPRPHPLGLLGDQSLPSRQDGVGPLLTV